MTVDSLAKNFQQQVGKYWYKRIILAVICLALAYGAASWAIDNGNLVLYVITILLVYIAIGNIYKALRLMFSKNVY